MGEQVLRAAPPIQDKFSGAVPPPTLHLKSPDFHGASYAGVRTVPLRIQNLRLSSPLGLHRRFESAWLVTVKPPGACSRRVALLTGLSRNTRIGFSWNDSTGKSGFSNIVTTQGAGPRLHSAILYIVLVYILLRFNQVGRSHVRSSSGKGKKGKRQEKGLFPTEKKLVFPHDLLCLAPQLVR